MEDCLCTVEKAQMAHEILGYLLENPNAQDSIEGIVEWWLLERSIRRGTAKVKEALAKLVAQGLVLEHRGRDSRTHYRINRRQRGEIRALLRQRSKG